MDMETPIHPATERFKRLDPAVKQPTPSRLLFYFAIGCGPIEALVFSLGVHLSWVVAISGGGVVCR